MTEICIKCGEEGEDRRTLYMKCCYDMNELEIPFEAVVVGGVYTLRVCKRCRSDWMKAIKNWFQSPIIEEESCGSGIFIREFGEIKEISDEEFARRFPGREPFRFID